MVWILKQYPNTFFFLYEQPPIWGEASSCLAQNLEYLEIPSPPTKYYAVKLHLRLIAFFYNNYFYSKVNIFEDSNKCYKKNRKFAASLLSNQVAYNKTTCSTVSGQKSAKMGQNRPFGSFLTSAGQVTTTCIVQKYPRKSLAICTLGQDTKLV